MLGKIVHEKALECGYDDCGIVMLDDVLDEYRERLHERMEKYPESVAVYESPLAYLRLKEDYPWAKSIVVCTEYFGKYKFPASLRGRYAKSYLMSSSVPEYPGRKGKEAFERWMAETGIRFEGGESYMPARRMPLRIAAAKAGLGIIRKNNFFYGPNGSYYGLEGYLTDLSCEYIRDVTLRPCSEKCNLCQRACKTCALSAPYTMNPMLCVSFWNTFGGGHIPSHLKAEQFGSWIMGCDNCQDACPHNIRHNWDEGEEFPGLKEIEQLLQPENIVNASDEELIEKVLPRSEYHLTPEGVNTLRICARRTLEQLKQIRT